MASFRFGFSGDDFDKDDGQAHNDVDMEDEPLHQNAVRPVSHKLHDMVGYIHTLHPTTK